MKIHIMAFGIAKEITGSGTIDAEVQDELTADGLKEVLKTRFPKLQELRSFMIAVNGSYADAGSVINAEDEIAIIPPVSGG